jgi:hypothetical protein
MLRTASSLPLTGLLTLGFDPARFQTRPPACYRASWQLPGPDSHRQATTSLRTQTTTTRYVTWSPPFCWAHERSGLKARRGELASPLPVSFVYDPADKVVLDPDASVQQAIGGRGLSGRPHIGAAPMDFPAAAGSVWLRRSRRARLPAHRTRFPAETAGGASSLPARHRPSPQHTPTPPSPGDAFRPPAAP